MNKISTEANTIKNGLGKNECDDRIFSSNETKYIRLTQKQYFATFDIIDNSNIFESSNTYSRSIN